MITIGCMGCTSTVRITGCPTVDGFFTCPVCRENAGVEIVSANPLPDFVVVEKVITARASNFYVYDNANGRMLTQFAYGRREDAQNGADRHIARTQAAPVADETAEISQAPATTCPVMAKPGNRHLVTKHCVECNARLMAKMSRESVEAWYRYGNFSQVEYEAFMFVWATSAVRHSAGGWANTPSDPDVLVFAAALRRHAGIPAPVSLAA